MLAAVLLFLVVLGVSLIAIVARADSKSWDARVFIALGGVDTLMNLYRAVMVLGGYKLSDVAVLKLCTVLAVTISWVSIEFTYSFPRNRPLPWRWRAPLLVWGAATATVFLVKPIETTGLLSPFYFLPSFVIMMAFLARNLRRAGDDRRSLYLVGGALTVRWAVALFVYLILWRVSPDAFESGLFFEATAVSLAGYLLISHALLRGRLFSVRGVLAQVIVYEGVALAVLALTAVAVEAALRVAPGPVALRVLLVGAALIPIAFALLGARIGGRIEKTVVRNVDPRGALRRDVLDRALRAEPGAGAEGAVAAVTEALATMTGGDVKLLRADPASAIPSGGVLSAEHAAGLAAAAKPYLVIGGGEVLATLKSNQRLVGALSLSGGRIDRDAVLAACMLAHHLALRLENFQLFGELEASKRLATLGSFAAAIAHDLRTPLTSVQMNVQILRGKSKAFLGADDMEHFDIALDELKRLNGHISELLDYAKPVKLVPAPVDLREVADDAAKGIEPILNDRHVALETQHATGLPPVLGDPQRIRQVLWNLLDNAAKASNEGGAIILRTRADGDGRVAVEVSDAGRGIAPSDLPRIFEPFFTTRPDGTGLGLAICQKLVRAHDGEIQVVSAVGKGSTFTVLLPAA